MRTQEELNSKEFQDDLTPLATLLKKKGIPYEMKQHRGYSPKITDLIGYSPVGKDQIIIKGKYSVIRGMVSFGLYEIMNIGNGNKFKEPTRFATPEELVDEL